MQHHKRGKQYSNPYKSLNREIKYFGVRKTYIEAMFYVPSTQDNNLHEQTAKQIEQITKAVSPFMKLNLQHQNSEAI